MAYQHGCMILDSDLDEIESDALIHHWLEGVEVHCNVQIKRIKWNESWQLESSSDKRQWKADGLIVTPPLLNWFYYLMRVHFQTGPNIPTRAHGLVSLVTKRDCRLVN